jgi:predicted RNA methylase
MRDLIADRALRDQLAVIVGGDDFLATLGAKDMLATLALTVLPEAIDRALTAEAEVERLRAVLEKACYFASAGAVIPPSVVGRMNAAMEAPHA